MEIDDQYVSVDWVLFLQSFVPGEEKKQKISDFLENVFQVKLLLIF